jgi:transcriptional regulator with XRE-family HTH domain
MPITTAQMRAARGLLNWSQSELADRTGISSTSIGSIENGHSQPREATLHVIQVTLQKSGIEFLPDQGVRLRSLEIQTFAGQQGFIDFFDDIYDTLRITPGEVLVSNVDEREFVKSLGDYADIHIKRMQEIPGVSYRILIREGDDYTPGSSYATYHWMPKEIFSSVPFYIYGDKAAIILFGADPKVVCLNYPEIAASYRLQFEDMWERSRGLK